MNFLFSHIYLILILILFNNYINLIMFFYLHIIQHIFIFLILNYLLKYYKQQKIRIINKLKNIYLNIFYI